MHEELREREGGRYSRSQAPLDLLLAKSVSPLRPELKQPALTVVATSAKARDAISMNFMMNVEVLLFGACVVGLRLKGWVVKM